MKILHIVGATSTNWDEPWRARHSISSGLTEFGDVLFVEALSYGFTAKTRDISAFPGLRVLSPSVPFPLRLTLYDFSEQACFRFILRQIKQAMSSYQYDEVYLWIFDYRLHWLIDWLKPARSFFYCNDQFVERAGMNLTGVARERARKKASKQMQLVASKVDLAVGVAPEIVEELNQWTSATHFSFHGVSPSLLENAIRLGAFDIRNHPREKRISYFGFINSRLDFELLNDLMDRLEGWELELGGLVTQLPTSLQKSFDRLLARRNVHYLGVLPHIEISNYLCRSSAGLMPYSQSYPTIGAHKTFDLVSCGTTIVSPSFSFTERTARGEDGFPPGSILIGRDADELAYCVIQSYQSYTPETMEQRLAFAKSCLYSERIEMMIKLAKASQPHLKV